MQCLRPLRSAAAAAAAAAPRAHLLRPHLTNLSIPSRAHPFTTCLPPRQAHPPAASDQDQDQDPRSQKTAPRQPASQVFAKKREEKESASHPEGIPRDADQNTPTGQTLSESATAPLKPASEVFPDTRSQSQSQSQSQKGAKQATKQDSQGEEEGGGKANPYKAFGRPFAKVFLGAMFTYQVLYYAWERMRLAEIRAEREAEMSVLEGAVEDYRRSKTGT